RILPSFEVSDLEDGLGALVEELEDSVVEVVDPGTPIVQVHRDSHYCLTRDIADYRLHPRQEQVTFGNHPAAPRQRRAARSPRARSGAVTVPGLAGRGPPGRTRFDGAASPDGRALRRTA